MSLRTSLRARTALRLAAVVALVGVSSVPSSAQVTANSSGVPLAARLLEEPWSSSGVRVQFDNLGNLRGLANDGEHVYAINASGDIVRASLDDVDDTPGTADTLTGEVIDIGWGVGGQPSTPALDQTSLAASHGCLWITDGSNSAGSIRLYCIDTTTWQVAEVAVPSGHPLPAGYYYVTSSLIDFPDGRIGKVSRYESDGVGGYVSTLRTYEITGSGAAATIEWSADYLMADSSNWATDEHGIATDGTYLYRIQWKSFVPNYKVWELRTATPATVVHQGQYTEPYGNMHFLSHDHVGNRYLVGHWDASQFFVTAAAAPGPGPGNPLIPTFGAVTPTADGFTVPLTNFDPAFDWSGVATAGGTVSVDGTGLVSVTGVAPATLSTVTVTASRTGYATGSASTSGTSLTPPATTTTSTTTVPPTTTTTTTAATPSTSAAPSGTPQPTRRPDGSLPEPPPGQQELMTDGVPDTMQVAAGPDGGIELVADGFRMTINGVDASGATLPLTDEGNLLLSAGRFAEVRGEGFAPGSGVDVWVFSEPRYLGRLTVAADGTFEGEVEIPADLASGTHTLQANGTSSDGRARSVSLGVEVLGSSQSSSADAGGSEDAVPDELAFTGGAARTVALTGYLLALSGISVMAARRRRAAASPDA